MSGLKNEKKKQNWTVTNFGVKMIVVGSLGYLL